MSITASLIGIALNKPSAANTVVRLFRTTLHCSLDANYRGISDAIASPLTNIATDQSLHPGLNQITPTVVAPYTTLISAALEPSWQPVY